MTALKRIPNPGHFFLGLFTVILTLALPLAQIEGGNYYYFDFLKLDSWIPKALLLLALAMGLGLVMASLAPGARKAWVLYISGILAVFWLGLLLYFLNGIPLPPGKLRSNYDNLDRMWIASIHLLAFGAMFRAVYPESSFGRWLAGLTALFIVVYFLMEAEDVQGARTRIRTYAGLLPEGGKKTMMGLYILVHCVVSLGAVLAFTQDALARWFRFVSLYYRSFIPIFFALYFFVLVPPGSQWEGQGTLWLTLCVGLYFAVCAELIVAAGMCLAKQTEERGG